jgi:hypothetical protein
MLDIYEAQYPHSPPVLVVMGAPALCTVKHAGSESK